MAHEAEVRGVGVSVGEEGYAPAVVLHAREEFVPIFVTADQAQSMQLALREEPAERPLTHDLLVDMVTEFGGAIDRVRIDDLAEGTFYAKVDAERYEEGESRRFVFDARPSDGIALALRVDCPILVTDEVLDEAGRSPEVFDLHESGEPPTDPGLGGPDLDEADSDLDDPDVDFDEFDPDDPFE